MKKILLLLICILFITGCSFQESENKIDTINYDLNISNHYVENITFTFPSNAYEIAAASIDQEYDSLEYILLIDNFSRPIHNNVYSFYGKTIEQFKNAIEVNLNYDYLEKDFVNSNYMNTCFEKHSIKDENTYLEIELSGEFYCLQDKTMIINVSSTYPEQYSNGDYVDGKTTWTIDQDNVKDVNIYYKVIRDKNSMAKSYGALQQHMDHDTLVLVEFLIIVFVLIGGFFFYKILYNKMYNK